MQKIDIIKGDIVKTPTGKIGLVVGIYGTVYYEVLVTRGKSTKIVPYRYQDLICIENIDA